MEQQEWMMESELFNYIEELKDLLSSELWENILLDCTKNELFVLWLLYRKEEVNMTGIAEYLCTPLNTATGIISRMEKRDLVIRNRSAEDKRIVTIRLGSLGKRQIHRISGKLIAYGQKVISAFSAEELAVLGKMLTQIRTVLVEEKASEQSKSHIRKITIE